MPGLCKTCQLYYANSGTCAEYGPVPVMPETCAKYAEDYYLTRRAMKVAVEKAAIERAEEGKGGVKAPETRPAAKFPPKVAPEVERQILELGRQGLTPWRIMKKLGLESSSPAYRVLRQHGLWKPKPKPQDKMVESGGVYPRQPGDCSECLHEVVCGIKDKAKEHRDWALCRYWMAREQGA